MSVLKSHVLTQRADAPLAPQRRVDIFPMHVLEPQPCSKPAASFSKLPSSPIIPSRPLLKSLLIVMASSAHTSTSSALKASTYSSLFTAGLFASNPAPTPSISVRPPQPPTSPPRRKRKSSVTFGSSPLAAIKSPMQRAQFSRQSAQKSYSILVTSPARPPVGAAPSSSAGVSSVSAVPENRSLMR